MTTAAALHSDHPEKFDFGGDSTASYSAELGRYGPEVKVGKA